MTIQQHASVTARAGGAGLAATALMLGNLVFGLAVLAPAGMLADLAADLSVSVRTAGALVAGGAVVLCIASPLMAWLTSTTDRRRLLAAGLALVALGHVASALAPDFAVLLAVRLVMLVGAAAFTPLAATTIAMMVPAEARSSGIAYVFLGWALALAAGLPLVTFLTAELGWRLTHAAMAAATALDAVALAVAVPAGLRGEALSLRSWGRIAHNRRILLLLLITLLWTAGWFVTFPYFGPLLARLAGADARAAAALFALVGAMGLVSNVAATRAVVVLGAFRTSLVSLLSMALGALVFAVGAGSLLAMGTGAVLLGFGFAINAMQQARLVEAAPALSSASVALNTSSLYVGQALGALIGGLMFSHGLLVAMGYAGAAFMLAGLGVLLLTRTAPQG